MCQMKTESICLMQNTITLPWMTSQYLIILISWIFLTCFLAPLPLTTVISFSGRAIFTNVGDLTLTGCPCFKQEVDNLDLTLRARLCAEGMGWHICKYAGSVRLDSSRSSTTWSQNFQEQSVRFFQPVCGECEVGKEVYVNKWISHSAVVSENRHESSRLVQRPQSVGLGLNSRVNSVTEGHLYSKLLL